MPGFFNALILICTNATGQVECEAVLLPEIHKDRKDCLRSLKTYEAVSGVCVDYTTEKYDNPSIEYLQPTPL